MAQDWIKISQAARQLDVSHMWIRRRIWNGDIAATDERLPGSKRPQYRVSQNSINEYFASRKIVIPEPVFVATT
jgi:hypothetical protein